MLKTFLVAAVATMALTATATAAQTPMVLHNQDGMPACLRIPGSHWMQGLYLYWDKRDLFQRTVHAIPMEQMNQSAFHAGAGSEALRCQQGTDNLLVNDELLARVARFITKGAKTQYELKADAKEWKGYAISADVQKALQQVREGGVEFRDSSIDTPEKFYHGLITASPTFEYTVETNHALTKRYGMQFSTLIYKLWLESNKENQTFMKTVGGYLDRKKSDYKSGELAARMKKEAVVILPGFMHVPQKDRLQSVYDYLKKAGIRYERVSHSPAGSMAVNASYLHQAILRQTSAGYDVIVAAGSKGVTDTLKALVDHSEEYETMAKTDGSGRVLSFLNLSGVVTGSYVPDWVNKMGGIARAISLMKIKGIADDDNLGIGHSDQDWAGLFEMTTPYLAANLQPQMEKNLPRSVFYVNVLGLTTEYGLSRDEQVLRMQNELVRGMMHLDYATDGFVVYPKNQIHRSWVSKVVDFPLEKGGHAVLDAEFQGHSLTETDTHDRLLTAILNAILDNTGKK